MSEFEIAPQGDALTYQGLTYWLDLASDPQTSIGWVVEPPDRSGDVCTVAEVAAIPGAYAWVISRTEAALKEAAVRAQERGWSREPVARLMVELEEARRAGPHPGPVGQ